MSENEQAQEHDCTASVTWTDNEFYQRDDGTDVMVEVGTCNECGAEVEGVWTRERIGEVE